MNQLKVDWARFFEDLKAFRGLPEEEFKQYLKNRSFGKLMAIFIDPPFISAEEIKAIREGLGFSAYQFAHAVGVKRDALYKWERGLCKPNPQSLRLLHLIRLHGIEVII